MAPICRRRADGFTLAELLVVLLLIGIFTGLMLAEMRGTFEDALLRSSAREVMSGLSLASSRAISLNQPHAFQLNRGENTFVVRAREKDRAADEQSTETARIDERITIEVRNSAAVPEEGESPEPAPEEQRVDPDRDVVRFYPDGTADAREVILRDNNNGELVLRINPVTGRVRVQEGP